MNRARRIRKSADKNIAKSLSVAALMGCAFTLGAQGSFAADTVRVEQAPEVVNGANVVITPETGDYSNRQHTESTWDPFWGASGGVIQNVAQDLDEEEGLTINGVNFDNNAVVLTPVQGWDWQVAAGGVIFNGENSIISAIENTTFTNNMAQVQSASGVSGLTARGGAIYNAGLISSIKDATFSENTAVYGSSTSGYGSAIYNSGTISTIDNVKFTENLKGDTLWNDGTIDTIQNSTFSNNASKAIFNTNTINTIKDTTFYQDGTKYTGAIIQNSGTHGGASNGEDLVATIGTMDNVTISDSKFASTAIYNWLGKIQEIKDSTIENNTYSNGNGYFMSLYEGSSVDKITNTSFSNNTNMATIYSFNSSIGDISDSTFEGNTINSSGGLIELYNSSVNSIDNTTFKDNTGIAVIFGAQGGSVGSISNSIFDNNKGAINLKGLSLGDVTNSYFTNNTTGAPGAAIAVQKEGGDGTVPTLGLISNSHFISNTTSSQGGAVMIQGGVTGKGIENSEFTNNTAGVGGAIAINTGASLGDIKETTFTGNKATNQGGAIVLLSSDAKLANLTSVTFKDNSAVNGGGAIANPAGGTIGNLTDVSFYRNSLSGSYAIGGAIYNNGTIGNWTNGVAQGAGADYVLNQGGILWNNGTFGDITNVEFSDGYAQNGGAIENLSKIGTISNSKFTNNHATASYSLGGAIQNTSGTIEGLENTSFENNSAALGGSIYNNSKIGNWNTGYAIGAGADYVANQGGILWNNGTFGDITNVEFSDGYAIHGGAIENVGRIGTISNSKFTNNHAVTSKDSYGGAIRSSGTITGIDNTIFENNSADDGGGAITTFGAITNGITNSTFKSNTAAVGGALFSTSDFIIKNSTFEKNKAAGSDYYEGNGGALWLSCDMKNIENSKFSGNEANASGGAIYHIGNTTGLTVKNSSFTNNTATNGRGGAIYETGDLSLIADGANSIFAKNVDSKGGNDIYLDSADEVSLNLTAVNNGYMEFGSGIDSINTYNMNIDGDNTSGVRFSANVYNANIGINNTNVYALNPSFLTTTPSVAVNSGTLNFNNLGNQTYNFQNLSNSGTINIGTVDVDVAAETMGRITADNYGDMSKGVVNVGDLNLLTDPVKEQTNVLFADKAFANTVKYGGKTEVYTPIYKYDINYLPGSGEFVFVRGNGSSMGDFNPAVLASPVSANAGSQVTVTETFKYVFEHADSFTQLASADRFAAMNKNTYAIGSTNFDQNMSLSADFSNNSAGWVRPYTSFESMHLNKGPKVDVVAYGSLVGYDTDFKHLKRGWSSVGTGYIGYNGSQLRYSGSSTTMNGGLLGFTETLYKGNFWTALTLSAGASVGETHTGYGKEDFTSLSAGVGSKTGYNFEFKEGKFIIQPVWFMSYTFVNTFDYKTAAGVQIDNDPSHTIQLNPSIRFIGNSKNGWQPYASVGMVWNLLNKSGSTANGVKLPETYVKPYVEYGVGLQKRWADKYSAFLQAMLRNGGRNGVSLTAGFRWSLGKEGKPIEKVSNPQNRQSVDTNRKVIKKTS